MNNLLETPVVVRSDELQDLSAAACMFRSLGGPGRLAILRHLAVGEHNVKDLTAHLGLAQSTVSAHLACLRDCGLCTYLSAVLLVGLLLNATLGWDWADPIAGLIIAAVAVKEGRAAWRGEACTCLPGRLVADDAEECGCAQGCIDACCATERADAGPQIGQIREVPTEKG